MHHSVRALTALCLFSLGATFANAGALDQLTNTDAASGLKKALDLGINAAVGKLGITDGFFKNPEVKIPLPPTLQKTEKLLHAIGLGSQADQLTLTMNRAAEAAVPEAKSLLKQSLKRMTVKDAKDILTGGDDAATQYFKRTTYEQLAAKFKPIVTAETRKLQLAQQYDDFAAKGAQLGLLKPEEADLESYVTRKALDGLFLMMATEEKSIRKDPMGQASAIVKKVFGALGKGG